MMKRTVWIVLALVLAGLVAGFFILKGGRQRVVITQAQIDQALQKRFPQTKPYLLIFDVTYSNPEVTLLPDSQRVRVGLDTELNLKLGVEKKRLGGGATLTAALNYRPETQEFFLTDPKFERLEIQGIPPKYLETVSTVAAKAAREYVERFPIYTLKATDGKTSAAKLLLKGVDVRDREVVVSLGL